MGTAQQSGLECKVFWGRNSGQHGRWCLLRSLAAPCSCRDCRQCSFHVHVLG